MSKHTPGRWVDYESVEGFGVMVAPEETGADIATCYGLDSNRSRDEEQANALLIAAAPDMLEALKALMLFIGDVPSADFNDDRTLSTFSEWVDKARAAIAKAEGRS